MIFKSCINCKNLKTGKNGFECEAFDVIPLILISGDAQHIKKWEGQKTNLIFEEKKYK